MAFLTVRDFRSVSVCALALVLAALAACAPRQWQPQPISAGTIAVLCAPAREVWCEIGDGRCAYVAAAVQAFNAEVPGLFVYMGEGAREHLLGKLADPNAQVTAVLRAMGAPTDRASLERLPIAFTQLRPEAPNACLPSVPIVLVWPEAELTPEDWRQVTLHEFLHSVGCAHAPSESPFSTIMRRAVSEERREGLSKADRHWLRAVYGGR